jgi:hypothetical protein
MLAKAISANLSRLYCGLFVGIPGIGVEEQSTCFLCVQRALPGERPTVHPYIITCACGESERGRTDTSLVRPEPYRRFPLRFASPDDRGTAHRLGRRGKAASFHPLAGGFAVWAAK